MMPTREVRIPGPGMEKILGEIADRLCRDDWERRSTASGEIAYYIVGFEAHRVGGSNGRAKAHLRDVARKYGGLLGRVGQLDPLEFADSQLEEASRCYLYGFNRAAVMCAAGSVETHLKQRTGKARFDTYSELT